jgi:hypothetical protein
MASGRKDRFEVGTEGYTIRHGNGKGFEKIFEFLDFLDILTDVYIPFLHSVHMN